MNKARLLLGGFGLRNPVPINRLESVSRLVFDHPLKGVASMPPPLSGGAHTNFTPSCKRLQVTEAAFMVSPIVELNRAMVSE